VIKGGRIKGEGFQEHGDDGEARGAGSKSASEKTRKMERLLYVKEVGKKR